jgi:hypothetical protein
MNINDNTVDPTHRRALFASARSLVRTRSRNPATP